MFETNQASGDHLGAPGSAWSLMFGSTPPENMHRSFVETGRIHAYAEGGPVNALARWLMVGGD